MDKLKALYESYINAGVLSSETTFEQFSTANPELQDTLYQQGIENKILSNQTDLNMFKSAWDLKKKENLEEEISSGVEEVTESVQTDGYSDSLEVDEVVEEGVINESELNFEDQSGVKIPNAPDRNGVLNNKDGSVSTHKMKTETDGEGNWFSFPTVFQNEDGEFVDMSEDAEIDWKPVYEEAKKRGEIIDFGKDKESALAYGKGSWKNKTSINEVEVENKVFNEFTDNIDTIETQANDPFSSSINTVNQELISGSEEQAVPLLNYHFNQYGFDFEETGALGDRMNVTSANGEKLSVDLDNFLSSNDLEESAALKSFLEKNKAESRRLYALENKYSSLERKITQDKDIDTSVNLLNTQANVFNKKVQGWVQDKRKLDQAAATFSGLTQAELNQPEVREAYINFQNAKAKNDSERSSIIERDNDLKTQGHILDQTMGRYSEMQAERGQISGATIKGIWAGVGRKLAGAGSLLTDAYINYDEFGGAGVGAFNRIVQDVALKMYGAKKDLDNAPPARKGGEAYKFYAEEYKKQNPDSTKKERKAYAVEMIAKESEKSEYNYKTYLLNSGLTEDQIKEVKAKAKDVLAKQSKFDIYNLNEDGGYDLKKIPGGGRYSTEARARNISELSEGTIIETLRTAPVEVFGSSSTTTEYSDLMKEGFWGGAYLGLMESIPAMLGGPGAAGFAQRTAGMFTQVSDHVNEEMFKDPDFANISENEKLSVAVPLGIIVGTLESVGFRNVVKQKGLLNKVLLKAIGKYKGLRQVQKRGFQDVVRQEVDNMLARGVLTVMAGGVAEFETGAAQEIADIGIKALYNFNKEADMFRTPDSIKDGLKQILKAGAQEAVGGWMMSVPGAMSNAAASKDFTRLDNGVFEVFEDMVGDGTSTKLIDVDLKNKVNKGEITVKEAKEQQGVFNELQGVYNKIPSDYSTKQKKLALGLLLSKQELEQRIAGRDPSSVKSIQDKIDGINSSLEKIGRDALAATENPNKGRVDDEEKIEEETKTEKQVPVTQAQKNLFGETHTDENLKTSSNPKGKANISNITSLDKEGVSTATYVNPETGSVDAIISSKDKKNFVGYVRIYENGKPTNMFSTKMESTGGAFKNMITSADATLPDGAKVLPGKTISEGGLKSFNNSKLDVETDSDGNVVTREVDYSDATKETVKQKGDRAFGKFVTPIKSEAEAEIVKIQKSYPGIEARIVKSGMSFSIKIDLPVLIKTNKDAIQEQSTESVDAQESSTGSETMGQGVSNEQSTNESNTKSEETKSKTQAQEEIDKEEASDFEALVNPDSKIESDIDNLPGQKQTVFSDKGVDVDIEVNQESPNLSFTKKGKTQRDNKFSNQILKQSKTAAKAISKIFPDIKIVVHRDNEQYRKIDADNDSGMYNPNDNTIHINLSRAGKRTVAHEIFHAVLLNKLKMNEQAARAVTKKMVQALTRSKTLDKATRTELKRFIKNYDSEIQNEEKLSEIVGMLSDNYTSLDASSKSVVRKWVEKIAAGLGIEIGQSEADVVDLLNVIARKTISGQEITEGDLKVIDDFEGGKNVKNPSELFARKSIGDFEISYTENEQISDYLKDGRITQPQNLEFMRGLSSALQSPDDMMVGQLKYKGKVIFEGQGGLFFVTKFGAVWAAGNVKTAKVLADMINRSVKENGGKKGFLTLTKGTDAKLVSSASGVNSTLAILETLLDSGLITPSSFRSAVSSSVIKAGGKINLRQSAKDLKIDVEKYFSDSTTTTFALRGLVVNDIITALAKGLTSPLNKDLSKSERLLVKQKEKENKGKIINFLGGDISKGLGAGTTPKSQSFVDLIAKVVGEKLVKGLNTGDVYAVIEVDGEVEAVEGDHKSYKGFIKQKNGNPPILHLLKDRVHGREYITRDSGKVYTGPAVATNEFVTYNISDNIDSDNNLTLRDNANEKSETETPEVRKQKSDAEKLGLLYKMNIKGFMPKTIPLGPLQQSARKLGLRVERALFKEGYQKGQVAGYYFSNGITQNGKPRFYNPRAGIRKQQSMGEIGRSETQAIDIIRLGRDNNIKDDTIVDYLKRNTVFLMKDINPLMKITNFALRNVPKVFGNIQGGMMSGIKVFNKVYEFRKNLLDNNLTATGKAILKLNAKIDVEKGKILQGDLFDAKKSEKIEAEIKKIENQISKIQKTAKAKNRKFYKFTQEEIDNATLDFLQSQPEYKAASNKGAYSTLQAQMTSQMMDAFEGGFMRGDAAARIKLARKLIKGRGKSDLQATQRDLRNFIRKSLPSYVFEKPEVMKLMRQITAANSKNIENLKEEVLEFVNKKTNTELTKKIRKILGGKYDDTQSGRKKAYKVSDDVRKRLESIQKIVADISSKTDYKTLKTIYENLESQISAIEKLDSIEMSKMTADYSDLQIALNFVNAQLSLDISIEKTIDLQSVIDNLNDLVNEGKSELEAAIKAKHFQYIDNFQRAYYEITGKKIEMYIPNPEFDNLQVESKSNPRLISNPESKQALLDYTALSQAKKDRVINKAKVIFSRITESMVGFVIGNNDLLNLMSKIGKMPGELFGGDLQEMVTFKIDESTNEFKARKMATTIIINEKVEKVYGKKWREKSQKDSIPASTGIVMSSGVEIEDLSQNQMAYLVNQYKDPSNQDSYVNKYGKDYPRVMKEMEALLNEEVQELMRWQVEEFFPSLYDGYNEAYKKVYRTSMPWNEHYAGRIYREGVEDNSVDVLSNDKGAYKGFASPGSTKSRVNNTKAIKSMDQMAAMMTYVNDMNYFAAFSENLNDIANIFGNQNIKDAIVNNYGKGPMKSIDTMIDTLSKRGVSKEYGMDWINNVTSAFVIGRLAINPTIFIKQLTSAPAYAVRIGFRNWMKYGTMGIPDMKANWKEITDNSIYIQDRYGESILRTLETYAPSKIQSLVPSETKDNIINALMYLVKQGDKGAIVIGGVPNYAFYKDQYRKKNPVATDQEVIDYAVKMFERDTKSSQQSSDIQDKDQYQTGGAFNRSLNMFLTSVKQYLRKEMTTTRNLYRKISSGGKEGKGTYWENVKTLAMYHSILPVIFQYISAGLPGVLAPWEDEDEETLLRAAVLGNLNGLFIIGSFVEAFGDYLTAKPWTGQDESAVPILTIGLKFFRELNDANQYNVTPFDKNGKQRTEESINESIAGKQNATKKAFFNLANAGLPLKQVERLIKNADLITSGKAQGAELIMRILQFSDYQVTSKEQKDAARKKKTKPRQKNLTNKELEKYNPEAYERKMQIQDEFRNSDMYRQQQEMKRQQKERREQMLDEMYN